jgi:hypothetical protein
LVKFKCTAGRFAGVLLSARALVHLNLHSNWIKDDGAGRFTQGLRECWQIVQAFSDLILDTIRLERRELGMLVVGVREGKEELVRECEELERS